MMNDIGAVMWKEWRELLRMGGSKRKSVIRLLFSVGLLGVIWPWQIGAQFVTSKLAILFAAFTALMYVAGAVPDSFAGERERHTLETMLASRLPDRAILLGKIAALLIYGLAAAAVMLFVGWLTVNLVHGHGAFLAYDSVTLLGAIGFSIITAGLMGAIGVLVSLRAATVKQAQQVLTTAMMILFFLPAIVLSTMPPEWQAWAGRVIQRYGVSALAAGLAVTLILIQSLLYAIAFARFKRARLILDQ